MSVNDIKLPAGYIHQIVALVASRGVDLRPWLALHGMPGWGDEVDDETVTMPWGVFRQLVSDARRLTGEASLGLLVGERLQVNAHGILGFAAMTSPTLREVVELFVRFLPLRTGLLRVTHEEGPQELRVVFVENRPLEDVRRPVFEAIVLAVRNVLDSITMGSCDIRRVAFPFPCEDQGKLAQSLFRCEVRYGDSWAGFVLPTAILDQPLRTANAASFREAARICQRELEGMAETTSLGARVRRLMLESRHGFPSLELTARRFHMTPRTLHRHLVAEGTSYKQILEEVRRLLAGRYLQGGQMTIQEIAYTLGYSDLANFRRAFKRWERLPPSAWREHHQEPPLPLPRGEGTR